MRIRGGSIFLMVLFLSGGSSCLLGMEGLSSEEIEAARDADSAIREIEEKVEQIDMRWIIQFLRSIPYDIERNIKKLVSEEGKEKAKELKKRLSDARNEANLMTYLSSSERDVIRSIKGHLKTIKQKMKIEDKELIEQSLDDFGQIKNDVKKLVTPGGRIVAVTLEKEISELEKNALTFVGFCPDEIQALLIAEGLLSALEKKVQIKKAQIEKESFLFQEDVVWFQKGFNASIEEVDNHIKTLTSVPGKKRAKAFQDRLQKINRDGFEVMVEIEKEILRKPEFSEKYEKLGL